jgi:hypothetical protein
MVGHSNGQTGRNTNASIIAVPAHPGAAHGLDHLEIGDQLAVVARQVLTGFN